MACDSKSFPAPSFLGNVYLTKAAAILAEKGKATVSRMAAEVAPEAVKQRNTKGEGLQPHQEEALKRLESSGGLILHHSTGSGKTKTFLTAIQRSMEADKKKRALVVAPASLVMNIDKELEKHKIKLDRNRLDVYSYEKATRMADELGKNKYSIAVADEAQRLRNPGTQRVKALSDLMRSADRRLLATATAQYNQPGDLAPLINIAADDDLMPEDKKAFENRYLKKVLKSRTMLQVLMRKAPEESIELKNKDEMRDIFDEYVHHYDAKDDPAAKDKFPTVTDEVIEAPMDAEQRKAYAFMEGRMPWWIKQKIRFNMPMDKKEKSQLNSFSSGVRQVSTGYRHYNQDPNSVAYTPKIEMAVANLEKKMHETKDFRGLVYSGFLDAGVNEYSRRLKERGINHATFTGALSAEQKDALVKDYNAGKNPVLVVSKSGAEGLDLKGTRLTQVLDPFFNGSLTEQVVGRGARYESHSHLPKEDRNMHIEYYRTVHPKHLLGRTPTSIDQYLADNSDDKAQIFDKVKKLMDN
jgi:SNF2 family DNA or RNA helicase